MNTMTAAEARQYLTDLMTKGLEAIPNASDDVVLYAAGQLKDIELQARPDQLQLSKKSLDELISESFATFGSRLVDTVKLSGKGRRN